MHRTKIYITSAIILFVTLLIATCSNLKTPSISSTMELNCTNAANKSLKRKELFKTDKRDFVKNQALVKFKTGTTHEAIENIAQKSGLKVIKIKKVSPTNLYLMEASDNITVEEIVKRLSEYEQVEYSEPNYIYKIHMD